LYNAKNINNFWCVVFVMQIFIKSFIFVIVLFAAQFATAQDVPEKPLEIIPRLDTQIKYPEDVDLSSRKIETPAARDKALTELNIDVTKVAFQPIQVFCQSRLEEGYDSTYKCQIKAIIAEREFSIDTNECSIDAEYEYPLSLTKVSDPKIIKDLFNEQKTTTTKVINGEVVKVVIDNRPDKITKKEVEILQKNYFKKCMRNYGWRNAYAWQDGRKAKDVNYKYDLERK
jgi:hypothetical protein